MDSNEFGDLSTRLRRGLQRRYAGVGAILLACFAVLPAHAAGNAGSGPLPHRGRTMQQVLKHFGKPSGRRGPVGQPPITRWQYPGFVVVFEHNLVLDSFRPGHMATLYHQGRLGHAQRVSQ